jgi:hypothetical protein
MSVVNEVLSRYGLRWEVHPYRVVVDSHPHLIVQSGPNFDLRESALTGARECTLAADRKRRQRGRFRDLEMSRQTCQTEQYNPPIQGHLEISEAENLG